LKEGQNQPVQIYCSKIVLYVAIIFDILRKDKTFKQNYNAYVLYLLWYGNEFGNDGEQQK